MNQECAVGYASEADIDAWMDLVALVRDAFPGLSLGEYRGNLRKAIAERRALCAKDARGLLGVLVLSDQHKGIGFLADAPRGFFECYSLSVGSTDSLKSSVDQLYACRIQARFLASMRK